MRDCRLRRIEAEIALGESFGLRASVAYKGTWIRLTRRFPARWYRDTITKFSGTI